MADKMECVRVVVRCRPISQDQVKGGHKVMVKVDQSAREITLTKKNDQVKRFTFDAVYGMESQQQVIFKETALPILESCMQGYNGTLFAYGQTGTGKTFTMDGDKEQNYPGIMPRTIDYIFDRIKQSSQKKKFMVTASYMELYKEQLNDLLVPPPKDIFSTEQKKKPEIHQHPEFGIYVTNISKETIPDRHQMIRRLEYGKKNRKHAETVMNKESSRSHAIFTITIENAEVVDGDQCFRKAKLNMVDLAGSERQSKTNVSGEELKNAIDINVSLTTLGLVIESLISSKKKHVPYRDSQLTRLLQDSLGGNTKTVMIANIGPVNWNIEQTISTLKYADRAKSIKNRPIINQDPKDAKLREYGEEIARLKAALSREYAEFGSAGDIDSFSSLPEGDLSNVEMEEKLIAERDKEKKKLELEKTRIMEQKSMTEQQRNQLIRQIEEKENEQQTLKEKHQKNLKILRKLEGKVLHGTQLEERARQKELEWKEAHQELRKQRSEQEKLRRKVEDYKDEIIDMQKKYASQQQEIDDKTKRIKHSMTKLRQIEQDNREQDEQYAMVIEELQERRRILQKEHKLKSFIMSHFISEESLDFLFSLANYNFETDSWDMPALQFAGNNVKQIDPQLEAGEFDFDELIRAQLKQHPNTFFIYTEEGPIRQQVATQEDKKKSKKRKNKSKNKKKIL